MDIKQKLAEIVCEYRGDDAGLNEAMTFDEMGFDSLDKVEMLMKIEEVYDITFDDDLKVDTVGQLIEKIEKLIK